MKRLLTGLILISMLGACSTTTKKEQEAVRVEERKPTTQTTPEPTGPTTAPVASQPTSVNPLKDPNNILSKRSVYFDFDQYSVKDEFKPMVTAHAKYMSQNNARVTIQGNCDERGSSEYNLALGQRRADAVKQVMVLSGAQSPNIETVSFGKEKPRATGHDEQSWAENRRADIVYQGE